MNCWGYGVPAEWLDDVRKATEDSVLLLSDRLPREAAEALLEFATGGKPRVAKTDATVFTSDQSNQNANVIQMILIGKPAAKA